MEREIKQVQFPAVPGMKMKRVAAYARVSTAKYDALHSLFAQVSHYAEYIQSHKGWIFAGVYADEGVSGTKDSRAEFRRMIADCKDGKIDLVLTKSISRFARNTIVLLETVRELKDIGVDVYFEEQNIHTMSPDGELMMTILASYAQEESLSASENQKWRIRKGFERGELLQLRFLFGYCVSKGRVEVDPAKSALVEDIFRRAISGEPNNAIARDLNVQGIPGERGGVWTPTQIQRLLANEKYTGNALLQKRYRNNHIEKKPVPNKGELPMYYSEGTHEAIIDDATYQQAQQVLEKCAQNAASSKPKEHSVFTGIIRCPHCGKNYKRMVNHGRYGYNCPTFLTQGKNACWGKCIPENVLKNESAAVLQTEDFDEAAFKEKIDHIDVPEPNHLIFVFRDGRTIERIWKDRSRSESWTQEMKDTAREQEKHRGGKDKCHKPDVQ